MKHTYVSKLAQHQIPPHAAREKLPRLVALSNLFAIVFSHSAALPRISERFQRATKHGKFSRAAWEFDIVQNSRQ